MANAKRDENRITTLMGVSSTDGVTPVPIYVDPTTHRMLTDTTVSQGDAAPSSTPSFIGAMYVDKTNKKIYFATGTSSSSDWTIVN